MLFTATKDPDYDYYVELYEWVASEDSVIVIPHESYDDRNLKHYERDTYYEIPPCVDKLVEEGVKLGLVQIGTTIPDPPFTEKRIGGSYEDYIEAVNKLYKLLYVAPIRPRPRRK